MKKSSKSTAVRKIGGISSASRSASLSAGLKGNDNAAKNHVMGRGTATKNKTAVTRAKSPSPPVKHTAADKGGARLGILGAALGGPVGSFATGMYAGATKSQRALTRHTKASTIIGSTSGAVTGGLSGGLMAGPVGLAAGAVSGAVLHGGLYYGGAKLGQNVGKSLKGRKRK